MEVNGMPIYYSRKNKQLAQELRKNMTRQERHLWYDFLSGHPSRFRRQKQFGRYIADFYCSSAKLIIELDGSQHYSEEGLAYDRERTAYLEGLGFKVIHIPNSEIDRSFDGVCSFINELVNDRKNAFPRGEGGRTK